jgi:hypothetical protein
MQAPSDTLFQARTSPARIAQPPRSLDPSQHRAKRTVSTRIHRLALAALVTLSVTGGAAHALAATVAHERALEHPALGDRWQEAGQEPARAAWKPGSADPIPEPPPPLNPGAPRPATAAVTPPSPPPPCSSR